MMKKINIDECVDQNELRFMQSMVMLVLLVAFVFNNKYVVLVQVLIFFMTILSPGFNPFVAVYRLARKVELIHPDWRKDNMAPHRFASMIGFVVSTMSYYFLYHNHVMVGWGLSFLIVGFGILALSGWCAGCYSYYMLNKLGVKGFFKHQPVGDTFPGARPPKN